MAKYTYDEVKSIFKKHGMILVSYEYHNRDEKLSYICDKHSQKGIQKMSLCGLQQGQKCIYCRYENGEPCNFILPEDIYQEETEKAGYKYVGFHKEKNFVYIDFVCPKHEYKGIQSSIWNHIKNTKCCCSSCNGNDRSTEDFQIMVHEKLPQIDVIGEYLGARNRVNVRCTVCGNEWSPIAYNLLSGYGCQQCYDNRRGEVHHTDDDTKLEKLQQMHPSIEFSSIPYYAKDYVDCKCKTCGCEWSATYANLTKRTRPTGCPRCQESYGEKVIQKLFKKWDIDFCNQYRFDDLRDKLPLPFDFYLPDFHIAVEYDGEHHFHPVRFGGISKERAEKQYLETVYHDRLKNQYCLSHNILLIRISYINRDNIEQILHNELVDKNVLK